MAHTANTSTRPTAEIQTSISEIRRELNGTFLRRSDEITILLVGLLAETNIFFLGLPGTGKSALLRGIAKAVTGSRFFEKLCTLTTEVDELFGGPTLASLEAGKTERNFDGTAADSHFVFLDEIWKMSSPTLNATLGFSNEKTVDGRDVPLRGIVSASNELPADGSLGALWDRYLLRTTVAPVTASEHIDDWTAMVKLAAVPGGRGPQYRPTSTITLEELDAAIAAVDAIDMPDSVIEDFRQIVAEVSDLGIYISPRRAIKLVRTIKAAAFLDGDSRVHSDHLSILAFGLWENPEDVDAVKAILKKYQSREVPEVVRIVDEADAAFQAAKSDRRTYLDNVGALHDSVKAASDEIGRILSSVSDERRARIMGKTKSKLDRLAMIFVQVKADVKKSLGLDFESKGAA